MLINWLYDKNHEFNDTSGIYDFKTTNFVWNGWQLQNVKNISLVYNTSRTKVKNQSSRKNINTLNH